MNLELHVKVLGALLVLLAVAHIPFAKRFGWDEETRRMSLLNRQIFYVHCFFIALVLALMGVLNVAFTNVLLQRGDLNKIVLSALVIFWAARLLIQFFVYDKALWKGNRFNTTIHVLFSVFWTYCVGVYGVALWRQFPK